MTFSNRRISTYTKKEVPPTDTISVKDDSKSVKDDRKSVKADSKSVKADSKSVKADSKNSKDILSKKNKKNMPVCNVCSVNHINEKKKLTTNDIAVNKGINALTNALLNNKSESNAKIIGRKQCIKSGGSETACILNI